MIKGFVAFVLLALVSHSPYAQLRQPYPTGAVLPSPKDLRDIPYVASKPGLQFQNLPPKIDLKPHFPTPGNQGWLGSCVGWAVAYLKTYQEKIERGWDLSQKNHLFSPAYIYNQIVISPGNCGSGSTYTDALWLLQNKGCATLKTMPYETQGCSWQPPDLAKQEAGQYKIKSHALLGVNEELKRDWYGIHPLLTLSAVKAELANGNPVLIGMYTYMDFHELSDGVWNTRTGVRLPGGHAVCVIGYDDDLNAFEIINSWGTDWGNGGYGWIDYDLFIDVVLIAFTAEDFIEANPVDFNRDGIVNFSDYIDFVTHFGRQAGEPDYNAQYDLDFNSRVDFHDFLRFAGAFGKIGDATRH